MTNIDKAIENVDGIIKDVYNRLLEVLKGIDTEDFTVSELEQEVYTEVRPELYVKVSDIALLKTTSLHTFSLIYLYQITDSNNDTDIISLKQKVLENYNNNTKGKLTYERAVAIAKYYAGLIGYLIGDKEISQKTMYMEGIESPLWRHYCEMVIEAGAQQNTK